MNNLPDANSASGRESHARPGGKRKAHARRSARSAAAERRRQQQARQRRPNVADLPRSASLAAAEAARRRRATASSRPLTQSATRSPRRDGRFTPLWRRLSDDSARAVTVFRRTLAPAQTTTSTPSASAAPSFTRAAAARRWWPRAGFARILISLALLAAIVLALSPTPMLIYDNTMALAKSGAAHLKSAEADFKLLATSPTNLATINSAQSELQLAHNDFAQLQLRLGLFSPVALLPNQVGAKMAQANKLVPLAVDGTQAGVLACDALKTLVGGLKDPLGTTSGLTSADMDHIADDMDQIQAIYGQMAPQLASLTAADLSLDPGLWPTVSSLQSKLPQVTQLVNDLDGAAHVLPQLLGVGKPATYLVEVLDSSELRPTGGFIGNFGALTLDGGRLDPGFHISDITLIDSSVKFASAPHQQFIPIPSKYSWLNAVFVDPNGNSWSLRDSNLDPNYPTAAQYALDLYPRLLPDAQANLAAQHSTLQLYDPSESGQFAGVITLSLGLFEQALKITGPISVPAFHETITTSNFVSKIHSYALGGLATGPDSKACGQTSCAKVFTSAVVSAFMAKVRSNLPLYIGQMGKLFYDSLKTKDVEVYLTPSPAQQLLSDLNLSAEVASPTTGDSVFEVDANIGANKDNYFLKYQMADQIVLDQAGAATHHLSWQYTWPRDPATLKETFAAGGPDYQSYSRVFTPPGAKLISQKDLAGFGAGSEFNRKVFHGSVTASYGRTTAYALAWKVPGAVTHDSAGYHYHLIFQREAGIVWPLKLSVTLPICATMIGAPVTSGLTAQNHVSVVGNVVTITGPLTMDAQVEINYACSSSVRTGSADKPSIHHLETAPQRSLADSGRAPRPALRPAPPLAEGRERHARRDGIGDAAHHPRVTLAVTFG